MGEELLWPNSMPSQLPEDKDIPLAYFGESNIGKLKTLYRKGLGVRYGRKMQTISGTHFNFSFTEKFWLTLHREQKSFDKLLKFKNEKYFHLIRNFKRYSWVLTYLYGATPIVHKSFLEGREHGLSKLGENDYILEDSTSLRMGGLGYTSEAQNQINVCFNHVDTYIKTIENARLTPYKNYVDYSENSDELVQLNPNLIQIDNEFYSTIRPKNIAKRKESALKALHLRGIEYIEVRLLDNNPFEKLGVSENQLHFIHFFLVWCLSKESTLLTDLDCKESESNFKSIVRMGRDPNLQISVQNKKIGLKDYLNTLFDEFELFAHQMRNDKIITILKKERLKIENNDLLPSQRFLNEMAKSNDDFLNFNLKLANNFKKDFSKDRKIFSYLNEYSKLSIEEEKKVHAQDKLEFSDFLAKYFKDIKINYG